MTIFQVLQTLNIPCAYSAFKGDTSIEPPYIVSNVFNFYCVIGRVFNWIKLYKTQQKEKQEAEITAKSEELLSLEV